VEFGKRTRLFERPAPLGYDDVAPSVHAGHEAIVACPPAPGSLSSDRIGGLSRSHGCLPASSLSSSMTRT
jgi:hypothetical protein